FADVFRNLRVSFAEFARFTADSPWTLSRRTTDEIKFYAVLHGNCGMQLAHGVRVKLARGDLVVLPHGTSHELTGESPGLGERQERADAFGVVGSRASPSAAARPPRVELVSGRLGLEHPHPMHWWALLPNVVVARTGANTLPWLESTLAFITDEAQSSRAGSQTLVGRLSDLLVLHVLRTHLMTLDGTLGSGANWLA